jgi:hypothetical protein
MNEIVLADAGLAHNAKESKAAESANRFIKRMPQKNLFQDFVVVTQGQ